MFSGWISRQIERDPESAVMYYKNASRRAQRKDGAASPRTLNLRKEYAVALHRVGRNEEAEAELTAMIAERGPMPNANDKSARSARIWHARLLYELGRFTEAEAEWRELSAEYDRLLGADHSDAIETHEEHAATLAKLDRLAEAEAEQADVVEKLTAANGTDAPYTLQARHVCLLPRSAGSSRGSRGRLACTGRRV